MMVTGFLLREAIRRWELRRDTAAAQFDSSLIRFPGDERQDPDDVVALFLEAEVNIALLQEAQSRYNLAVSIDVLGTSMTLCAAVKRLGGAGRLDKMWRTAVGGKKDRHSYHDPMTRKTDEVRAERVINAKQAMERANKASAFAGALRAGIAKGNGTELGAEALKLDPKLLAE